jgi:CelD/BcsL family acetyltransferase involved in cellulose biosynthesis
MRRLADLGAVVVETASAPDQVKARFEEFLRLEAAGWKGKRHTALAELPPIAAMAREIVGRRAAAGAVRVDSIRLGGRPIAMLVSFLSGATAYSWKIAYDETYEKASPGAQLMLEAGNTLLSNAGIRRIDSLADANHPMIDHLWHERLAIGTLVIGPAGGGLVHAAGLASMKAEIRAKAVARRALRR